ncbi:MAG: porin family protein [Bradymonadaceae bacterium]
MTRLLALSILIVGLALPASAPAETTDDETTENADDRVEQQVDGDADLQYFGRFHAGIIGGPALSIISADDEAFQEASELVVRYSLGLHGEYRIYRGLGVALELLFSRRGWVTGGEVLEPDREVLYEFSYFDVPLLVQLGIPVTGRIAPRVAAGPFGRIFVEGSRGAETSGPFIGDERRTDIDTEDVNQFQMGLTVSAGVDIDLPDQILSLDLRYMHDFTDIFDDPVNGGENVRHRSVLAMIGLLY